MEFRELDNLILNDETKVLIGSFTIVGDVTIKNSELIVFGHLTIHGDVTLENSELIVSGALHITGACTKISNVATDISVGLLELSKFDNWKGVFSIEDGDIFVAIDFDSDIEISSNSDITVLGRIACSTDISCLNLYVDKYIDACSIYATLDIYCLSYIDVINLYGRDIFSGASIACAELHAFGSVYWENNLECRFSGSVGK